MFESVLGNNQINNIMHIMIECGISTLELLIFTGGIMPDAFII